MFDLLSGWLVALGGFLANLMQVIGRALLPGPNLPQALLTYPHPGWLALAVAVIAGVSQLIGDSVILFFNRVRPARFVAGLLLNGVLFPLGLVVSAAALWLVATIAFQARQPLALAILIEWAGSAPLIFGFLIMAATLGRYARWVLRVWSWLVVLLAVRAGFGLAVWQALVCMLLGWVLVELMSVALGKPLGALSDRLWRLVTGARAGMSPETQHELRTGALERRTVLRLSSSLGAQVAAWEGSRETGPDTPTA